MVIRTRLRAVLFPVLLYCVSGGIGGYFVWHALNGERGLKTKEAYEAQITLLRAQLQALQTEHGQWQHKIDLMKGPVADRDLLDEEARTLIGRAHKNDLVIFLPAAAK